MCIPISKHLTIRWLAALIALASLLAMPAQAAWKRLDAQTVTITQTPRAFDRTKGVFFSYVTLTYTPDKIIGSGPAPASLKGPFHLVIPTSTIGGAPVQPSNKTGLEPPVTGEPFILINSPAELLPGQPVTVRVEFPSQRGVLAFTTRVDIQTDTVLGVTASSPGAVVEGATGPLTSQVVGATGPVNTVELSQFPV